MKNALSRLLRKGCSSLGCAALSVAFPFAAARWKWLIYDKGSVIDRGPPKYDGFNGEAGGQLSAHFWSCHVCPISFPMKISHVCSSALCSQSCLIFPYVLARLPSLKWRKPVRYGTNGGLTKKELRRVPLRLWAKAAAEGDDEGPLCPELRWGHCSLD